jgi:hypothetical protein
MAALAERVGLELYCEVTTYDGATFKWDANQPPANRLRNVSFSTKIGEGFSLLTGTLARRIDQDYPDLKLGSEIVCTLPDGTVVFEGRLSTIPRQLGQTHAISVTFVGHMAHAKDRKFSAIYVDRDLGQWGAPSATQRANMLVANQSPVDAQASTDTANSASTVSTSVSGAWASPYKPASHAWYDAGPGNLIGAVRYSWKRQGALDAADTGWDWRVYTASDDVASATLNTGNLRALGPATLQTFTSTTPYRYAILTLDYTATPAGADGATYEIAWSKLAVYGDHGLTTHTGEPGEPPGLYVSDILRDIAGRFCPEFDVSGVEDYDYVVQHCVYRDTFPYDAFLDLNKYALAHLGVWEGKRLTFRPYDLTDYDWEIRTDDEGTTFDAAGPTLEEHHNGVVVRYTDLQTGIENVITPDDEEDLRDTSEDNPWNQWGRDHWYEDLTITGGQLEQDALQIGRAVLAEKNRIKYAGTLTATGYVRDRAGNPQPVAKVRAGDRICISTLNEVNRLVVETDYDAESKVLRVAVDLPFSTLEALFDRQANARLAKGV